MKKMALLLVGILIISLSLLITFTKPFSNSEIKNQKNNDTSNTVNYNDIDKLPPATVVSLEEKIGQLFIIGHWVDQPVASTTNLITKHKLGGVILMGQYDNASTTKQWVDIWQKVSSIPLIVSVDQEGGPVTRFKNKNFTLTGQKDIEDTNTAYRVGHARGQELASMGINVNLAPVLDSTDNPDSFMYQRVFKNRTQSATLAGGMLNGMKDAGVIGAVKHFPGHNDTDENSHHTLPTVNIKLSELDDYVSPFAEIIKNNSPSIIMTAHVLFPKIDPAPATLSSFFLTDYLRHQLGFDGVIMTDGMSMKAITSNWKTDTATVKTLIAGTDIVLFAAKPKLVENAIMAVKEAVNNGSLPKERIDASYNRIIKLKENLK